jgi:hypothetical protein
MNGKVAKYIKIRKDAWQNPEKIKETKIILT